MTSARWSRMILISCLIPIAIGISSGSSNAQTMANMPGFKPVIYGLPVSCTDVNGNPVYAEFGSAAPPVGNTAKSILAPNGDPVIVLDPNVQMFPRAILLFTYTHECMHHHLGHVVALYIQNQPVPTMEPDADCAAIKLLRDQNLISPQDVQAIAAYFYPNPPYPPFYPPGPVRAAHIVACYQQNP